MAFEFLEKPVGTLDLLLFLMRNGPTKVADIVERAGLNRGTYYRAESRLVTMGLAYEAEETGFPVHVYVGLTREGEAIARALVPAAGLLTGAGSAPEGGRRRGGGGRGGAGPAAAPPRRGRVRPRGGARSGGVGGGARGRLGRRVPDRLRPGTARGVVGRPPPLRCRGAGGGGCAGRGPRGPR